MSSREEKLLTQSKSVEVVADQSDDGSYELRVSSHGGEDDAQTSASNTSPGRGFLTPERARPGGGAGRKPLAFIFGGVALTAMTVGAFALFSGDNGESKRRAGPQTVEIDEAPRFRGYVVAPETFQAEAIEVRFDEVDFDAADAGSDAAVEEDDQAAARNEEGLSGEESDESGLNEDAADEAAAGAEAEELDAVVRERLSRIRVGEDEETSEEDELDEQLLDEQLLDEEFPDEEFPDEEYLDDEYLDEEYLDEDYPE